MYMTNNLDKVFIVFMRMKLQIKIMTRITFERNICIFKPGPYI